MSKSIKVSEDTYQMLLGFMRPRETFSELIARLLTVYVLMEKVLPFIREQQLSFRSQVEKADAEKAAHG